MTNDDPSATTVAERLAEALARRKALTARGHAGGAFGQRATERTAAARSASKSKPAPRKS